MFSHHCRGKPTKCRTKNSFDRQTCIRDETENLKRPHKNDRGNAFDDDEGKGADGSRVKLGWCITYCTVVGGVPLFEPRCHIIEI
jgi:hypothetical protein